VHTREAEALDSGSSKAGYEGEDGQCSGGKLNKTYRGYDGPLSEEACTKVSTTLGIYYTIGAAKKGALRVEKRCWGLGEREERGGGGESAV
jgi:hypothetical protein